MKLGNIRHSENISEPPGGGGKYLMFKKIKPKLLLLNKQIILQT